MRSVIVTYPNGRSEIQSAPIPKAPPHKLEKAFQYDTELYLHNETTGNEYRWCVDGSVRMYNSSTGIMYDWTYTRTIHDALLSQAAGETYIFKSDGTVIFRTHPYPFTKPSLVWEFVWPQNPEFVLVDGRGDEKFEEWDDYMTDHGDEKSVCSRCSSGEQPPGRCDHFYEDTDDEKSECHEHPDHSGDGTNPPYKCWDKNCEPCPGCRGPYDGADHGGLGCSRECAYHTDEYDYDYRRGGW